MQIKNIEDSKAKMSSKLSKMLKLYILSVDIIDNSYIQGKTLTKLSDKIFCYIDYGFEAKIEIKNIKTLMKWTCESNLGHTKLNF